MDGFCACIAFRIWLWETLVGSWFGKLLGKESDGFPIGDMELGGVEVKTDCYWSLCVLSFIDSCNLRLCLL